MWNVKNKCDTTNNNNSNRIHLEIIKKIPEQHTGKARNQRTTENSHTGHCTHTAENADVKVQYSIFNIGNSAICTMYITYRIAATLHSPGTWFVSGT
jgi:hypothetical protein